jgi:hypothetical protein
MRFYTYKALTLSLVIQPQNDTCQYLITWHPSKVDCSNPGGYFDEFRSTEVDCLSRVAGCITKHVWSPCTWRNGRRKKTNFIGANLLVLDFDNGKISLEDASEDLFAEYRHIIAPTKSHTSNHPRFRVILTMSKKITNKFQYESNLRPWIESHGADSSCVDAARFFFPSTVIYSIKLTGDNVEIYDFEEPKPKSPEQIKSEIDFYKSNKTVPKWIQGILTFGVPVGERHKTCFKLGANLRKFGFEQGEVVEMIRSSPINAIPIEDIERAVKNGFDAVLM